MGDKNLRVLFLGPADPAGERCSSYTFLAEEMAAMVQLGCEVHTISPHVADTRMLDGVKVHPVPRVRDVIHTLRSIAMMMRRRHKRIFSSPGFEMRLWLARHNKTIEQVLLRERLDVVYSPFLSPDGSAGLAGASDAGVPLVLSLRGKDVFVAPAFDYGDMRKTRAAIRATHAIREADHVIGVSRALVDRAIEIGAAEDRVSVVWKGVDHERFRIADTQAARQALGLADRPTILFVGYLEPLKGTDTLLEAFLRVRDEIGDAQLVLCGDGVSTGDVHAFRKRHSLEDDIHAPGRIERKKMPLYFQACDVFTLPSVTEGSGNVIVEAGACGKPSVGSRVGGIPDYVDEDVTGLLFEMGNSADLAARLVRILGDSELAARMGAAARLRVETEHTYGRMLSQILTIFRLVARGYAPNGGLTD